MLTTIDDKWKDHLYDLDHLKASIGFRGWGQKDPLIEYKKEAYEMFVDLMNDLRSTLSQSFFKAQITVQAPRVQPSSRLMFSGPSETPETGVDAPRPAARAAPAEGEIPRRPSMDETGISQRARSVAAPPPPLEGAAPATDVSRLATNRGEEKKATPVTAQAGPGRNELCPCGSGKKYKKCHGKTG
jgi:preprotein translocase subunit SecA